ncbi:MAG: hypothetical protein WBW94_16240 [Anaerolineales bacterium]
MSPDLIAGFVAFVFTLFIFSYLIGDNPLFRIAVYIFVGVSAGYVASVAWRQVIWPDLFIPLLTGPFAQKALLAVPLILSALLLTRVSPRLTQLGMPTMALLVGVSAAVAVGGAVTGTLLPQVGATINLFNARSATSAGQLAGMLFNGAWILAGVITTLVYFHFGARALSNGSVRRFGLIELIAFIGSIFLAITLGVLFAGVYSAALTALIDRLHFFGTLFGLH